MLCFHLVKPNRFENYYSTNKRVTLFLGALGQLGGGAPAKPGKSAPAPHHNLTLVKQLPAAQLMYPGR